MQLKYKYTVVNNRKIAVKEIFTAKTQKRKNVENILQSCI